MAYDLLGVNTRVSVPFISVKIGDYSFGLYNRTRSNLEINGKYYAAVKVTYPNYMKSLTVTKVNGTLNTYELTMVYPITQFDDPNLIDKILSSVSSTRKITFTYGDCATPSFMYKNEEAIITNVTSQLDVASSKITYRIQAVSAALVLAAGTFQFPRYSSKKPSDIIKEILYNKTYGLQDVFYGMHNRAQVAQLGLIPGDDRAVTIEAKNNTTILDYLSYLVSCMSSYNDTVDATLKTAKYVMTIHDDTSGILDGPYFQISKVLTGATTKNSLDYYTIDIGYPNKDLIKNFSVDDDQAYPLLYEYSGKLSRSDYVYRIDDYGDIQEVYSPSLTNSSDLLLTTAADRTWWSEVTQFPINATLTIRGLLRAAVLMSYVRVNVYFYGKPHNSSGLYVIKKQVDEISESGYQTTLSLVRVGESGEQS